jgi:hypothetical protein
MNDKKEITARGILKESKVISAAQVADLARQDKDFMQVAEIYTGRKDFDAGSLVADLITSESVPALPVFRYKAAAMDKRKAWERTWELQRQEDSVDALFTVGRLLKADPAKSDPAIQTWLKPLPFDAGQKDYLANRLAEAVTRAHSMQKERGTVDPALVMTELANEAKKKMVGEIPVPPKYTSADFLNSNLWRLRGKLDVPKERWVSFPHSPGEDGSLLIAWAGYDHLQLARAVAERYEHAKEQAGQKHIPLLASIGQLIPWLKQWHNELDSAYGTRMGDYFESYLAEEAKAAGFTIEQVMAWVPEPATATGRRRKKQKDEVE